MFEDLLKRLRAQANADPTKYEIVLTPAEVRMLLEAIEGESEEPMQ